MSIYTVHFSSPFWSTIAEFVYQRYNKNSKHNYIFDLANLTILVPNRRSVRTLIRELSALYHNTTILPKIIPIMDLANTVYEELFFKTEETTSYTVIDITEQQLVLMKLIKEWGKYLNITADYAMFLAKELIALINQCDMWNVNLEDIQKIIPENLSKQWQDNLQFLEIVLQYYPAFLEEHNQINIMQFRNHVTQLQLEYWLQHKSKIIIAGETGLIPYTANIIQVVSKIGDIIFPFLDCNITTEIWRNIDYTHPYYHMKKSLQKCNCELANVELLTHNNNPSGTANVFTQIMLPANNTYQWANITQPMLLNNVNVIECEDIYEEGRIISLIIRDKLECANYTINLVTNNHQLTKYVVSNLKQWNINCNSSAGTPFNELAVINFMAIVINLVQNDFSPLDLIAFINNNLTNNGVDKISKKKISSLLNKKYLRGIRKYADLVSLIRIVKESDIKAFLQNLEIITKPLHKIYQKAEISFIEILTIHIQVCEDIATSKQYTGQYIMWHGDIGMQVSEYFSKIKTYAHHIGYIKPQEYLQIFQELMREQVFRPKYSLHPRINILTLTEAYLQHADITIIADLNQDSIPSALKFNPWLNNNMQHDSGLPPLEEKHAHEANIFLNLIYQEEIYLTRAKNISGNSTICTSWLVAIKHLAEFNKIVLNTNHQYQIWLQHQESSDTIIEYKLPAPKIQMEYFPKKISITRLEDLSSNPYIFYCKKILNLHPLQEVELQISSLEFGNIVHEIISHHINSNQLEYNDSNFHLHYSTVTRKYTCDMHNKIILQQVFYPRIRSILIFVLSNLSKCINIDNSQIFSEKEVKHNVIVHNTEFTITSKVDLFVIKHTGDLYLVDFKTGSPPSATDIANNTHLQLPFSTYATCIQYELNREVQVAIWELKGIENHNQIHARKTKDGIEQDIIELLENFYGTDKEFYFNIHNKRFTDVSIRHLSRCNNNNY